MRPRQEEDRARKEDEGGSPRHRESLTRVLQVKIVGFHAERIRIRLGAYAPDGSYAEMPVAYVDPEVLSGLAESFDAVGRCSPDPLEQELGCLDPLSGGGRLCLQLRRPRPSGAGAVLIESRSSTAESARLEVRFEPAWVEGFAATLSDLPRETGAFATLGPPPPHSLEIVRPVAHHEGHLGHVVEIGGLRIGIRAGYDEERRSLSPSFLDQVVPTGSLARAGEYSRGIDPVTGLMGHGYVSPKIREDRCVGYQVHQLDPVDHVRQDLVYLKEEQPYPVALLRSED